MFKSKSREKHQETRTTERQPKGPAYLKDVVEKLKLHPRYRDLTDEQYKERARQLTDKKELQAEFSHLMDEAYEGYARETKEESEACDDKMNSSEVRYAITRAGVRHKEASKLPIKLLLRHVHHKPPSRLTRTFSVLFAMKYGPLHAAIQVGDIIMEWNNCSLIIPEQMEYPQRIFETDLSNETEGARIAAKLQPKMNDAIREVKYNQQIDLKFDEMVGWQIMLENLKDLIVKYNRYYRYNLFSRNCQTFVNDAMEAMGAKDIHTKFTGKLHNYFKDIKAQKTIGLPTEFLSHDKLDRYIISANISKLTQHDKEYLLCLYFQFHLRDIDDGGDDKCLEPNCQMSKLEAELNDAQPLILLSYD